MKNFGLIGSPLGHSLSSFIHKEIMKQADIKGTYSLFEIEKGDLKNGIKTLKRLDGFNVTIPHKIDIIDFTDSLSERAKLFNSVNTVICTENRLRGTNTDCTGFTRSLKRHNMTLNKNVLLCGAGGVARMIAYETMLAGGVLTIAARNKEQAQILSKELNKKFKTDTKVCDLNDIDGTFDLLVNATPVGMSPNTDCCPVKKEVILNCKNIFDTIYNPYDTKLLKIAKANGINCSNGLEMLVGQAVAAQEIWNCVKIPDYVSEEITELTRKELQNR